MMYEVIKKCPLKILPGSLLLLALLLLFSTFIDAVTPSATTLKISPEMNNEKRESFDKDTSKDRQIGEILVVPQQA